MGALEQRRAARRDRPATGASLARVACATREDVARAIDAADRAFPAWARLTAPARSRILRNWFELILEHVNDLAAILTAEQGKPLREAVGEIRYGAGFTSGTPRRRSDSTVRRFRPTSKAAGS